MAAPHLHSVPDPPASRSSNGNGGGGGNMENRLTALETHLKYLATKEDLEKLKVWWLIGILSGMALAATLAASIAIAIVRLL